MICMKKSRFSGHPRTNWALLVHSPGPTCNTVIACSHSQTCVQRSPLGNGEVTVTYKVVALYRQGFSQKGVQPSHGHPFLEEIQGKFP